MLISLSICAFPAEMTACMNKWLATRIIWRIRRFHDISQNVTLYRCSSIAQNMGSNVLKARDIQTFVINQLGSRRVRTYQSDMDFDMILWLDSLQPLHADALGLHGVKAICMYVTLPSETSIGAQHMMHRPEVSFSLSGPLPLCGRTEAQYSLVAQIRRICEAFYANHWPCRTKFDIMTFLIRLYKHIEARIPHLGNLCIVCGRQQQITGLKPVPCKSKTCNLAFDEDGVGADLRDIYTRPVIADLLISMASSACMSERRDSLFKCIPSEFYLATKGHVNNVPGSHQIDWNRMIEAFAIIPDVAVMATIPDLQQYLLGRIPHAGVRAFRLLRSVLNSCRGHLMQLQAADQFPTMKTEYQFRLCTESPHKEEVFSRRKKKYGSRFLFHGSPFYNWHCILREGLKNMSSTNLMSSWSSQGHGIYLAEESSTSASYCPPSNAQAYTESIFGTSPACIALCEVINCSNNNRTGSQRGMSGSIRVVPDADNVITRYLFVYRQSAGYGFPTGIGIPGIMASSLEEICNRHATTQADIMQKVKCEMQQLSL